MHTPMKYSKYHNIKVSSMEKWSAPLRRARRVDQNSYIIRHVWRPGTKVIKKEKEKEIN
jgi:hypothetical protein